MLLMLVCQVHHWSSLGVLHRPAHYSSAHDCHALHQNQLLLPLDQHTAVRDAHFHALLGFIT